MNNIWVFAQTANGAPTSGTLELATKARSLGTVTAFLVGDAGDAAGALGAHGVTKVYATGDLGGHLPGVAVAAAMKAVIDGGDAPDLILFPQNYEGRDVMARLSVQLDRTVLTNNVDIAVDGDAVSVTTPTPSNPPNPSGSRSRGGHYGPVESSSSMPAPGTAKQCSAGRE